MLKIFFPILLKMIACFNFNFKQNYIIDLYYNSIPGINLYFEYANQTIFIVNLRPSVEFDVTFKIYTNNQDIKDLIDRRRFFVGIDFNTKIIDSLRTDIIICFFEYKNSVCKDYIFDKKSETYYPNLLIPNKYIPSAIYNISDTVLKENVIEYDYYVSFMMSKFFPKGFDNYTLLYTMNENTYENNISAFYGVFSNEIINSNEVMFNNSIKLSNGEGLNESSQFLNINIPN